MVVPKRHFSNWFDAALEEQTQLLDGIAKARTEIDKLHAPDGYNIGINVGEAGGQTVPHLHIHVIPRFSGDVRDPRGGVRYVIPGKGNYLGTQNFVGDGTEDYDGLVVGNSVFGSEQYPLLDSLVADIDRASSVDLAVAFVTESGLLQVQPYLEEMLERGGKLRFLTGDYMDVTEPRALLRLHDLAMENDGRAEFRVFQTDGKLGFHPKAYLLNQDYEGIVAYVGSSNLTKHALVRGLEWNQRITGNINESPISSIRDEFERLFAHARTTPLTVEWISDYSDRRQKQTFTSPAPVIDVESEALEETPTPHPVQAEALAALEDTRAAGNQAGLVVMATGLGKTWLAAFDSENFGRVLFVAHREEILKQARSTFRRIRPDANLGMYQGGRYEGNADVVFASVQTLGRVGHLRQFDPERFDYIVVDEFHHAAAATYRRLIDYFEPKFMLGLTATPERTDGGDLLALCGENTVFRCDLVDGINRGLLSPFHYFGVPDEVDFSNIPWRNGKFDPKQLEYEVATEKRSLNAYDQWSKRAQTRTLAFCVSMRHADHMAEFFQARGVQCVAVHSGPSAAPRTQSLQMLEAGELQVVFAVDMFNEGVDVPLIDTVMMLRPTESKILWLQQFGRGLRKAESKSHLTVVDYIGNHRSFLQVPMMLLPGAGSKPGEVNRALLNLKSDELELPQGCSVEYELEALDILLQLSQPTSISEQMTHWYRTFREVNGRRPIAVEAFHEGYGPKNVRSMFGSWIGFVNSEGDLSTLQTTVFEAHREFIEQLEKTPMTKSFKMVVLQSMLAAERFPGSISISDLVARVQNQVNRLRRLQDDFGEGRNDADKLRNLLEQNPIAAWVDGRGMAGKSYFNYDGETFSSFDVANEYQSDLAEFVREIADWRVAQYLDRALEQEPEPEDEPSRDASKGQLALWREYVREDIPPLWGFEFNAAKWQQGFVSEGSELFLLVSLNKQGMADAHQYEDKFLSDTVFQWLSQNRTKRDSGVGTRLKEHKKLGLNVQLFIRDRRKTPRGKAAPFVYCGAVAFESWEGDKPITVRWRLEERLPESLAKRFGL